jgi:DNA-binding GntR family transcriptional regulator
MSFKFKAGKSKKAQVADDMRDRIGADWAVGASVGDVMKLADYYGCSFGTVREAEQLLVEEGLLSEIKPGHPTRVIALPDKTPSPLARLRQLRRDLDAVIAEMECAT